jgi:hypothetical protein
MKKVFGREKKEKKKQKRKRKNNRFWQLKKKRGKRKKEKELWTGLRTGRALFTLASNQKGHRWSFVSEWNSEAARQRAAVTG